MSEGLFNRAFALFAAALLIAPAAFMAYAPPARAIDAEVVSDTSATSLAKLAKQAYSAVKEAITSIAAVTSAAKDTALVIERYVLQPLAYITTGNLLKKITSSMLGFVGGKNALGKPLYIQDMRGYIQNVGDVEAYSFLSQFQKNSNSPFAGAIASSLRANYLQGSSLAGFFAANKSTLSNYSSNPSGYVAGNWSLGGWAAWFGLTTVDQNNPYTDYYLASDQMNRQYQTAQTAKITQAIANQNFLNWCGSQGGATAGGQPTNVTSTDNSGTSFADCLYAGDPTCGSSGSGDTPVSCPADTVQAGTICGCDKPGGCDVQDSNQPGYDANTYVLPIGYSCPNGSSFDNQYGGCVNESDGAFTTVLDSSGNPVYQTDSSPSLDAYQNGATNLTKQGAGSDSSVLAAITDPSKINPKTGQPYWQGGIDQYGGYCAGNVEAAHCNVQGGAWCTGANASSFATIATQVGYTSTTVTGSTNQILLPQLQDGYIVQTPPVAGHKYGHVCEMYGGVCYSDTAQRNIVPYSTARNSTQQIIIWKPSGAALAPSSRQLASAATGASSVQGAVLAASTANFSDCLYPGDPTCSAGGVGVKPGDPCTKSDGTAGVVQTPGSVLKDYLSNTLKATGLDKLIAGAGDLSTQINGILGDIGTVMKTVDMASNLFGGSSSGLLAFSGNSAYSSPFANYLNSPGYMGLTTNTVYQNAQATGVTSSDLSTRVADYQAAWNTIGTTATAASAALNKLATSCSAQAGAAQAALATEVGPVLANWAAAQANVVAANGLLAKAATDATSSTDPGAYTTDIQLEVTQPPTAADVASAQAEAQVIGTAAASPAGSLTVSGGVTVDRMNLITANAGAMLGNQTYCPPVSAGDASSTSAANATDTGGSSGGG